MTRALVLFSLCMLPIGAFASVPGYVEVQGRVVTAGGLPFSGSAPVKIGFYASATSATPLYLENLGDLSIQAGLVSARVGPLDASVFVGEAWAEFEISGKALPRVALGTAPYAFHASFAESAAGLDCAGCVEEDELAFDPATQVELEASETAATSAFVNVTGDSMTGDLSVSGAVAASTGRFATARLLPQATAPVCDAATIGTMYFDAPSSRLHVCTATGLSRVSLCGTACPAPSAVQCGAAITSGCGDVCGGSGTGLSATDCLYNAQLAACGAPVEDDCGNICGLSGTAFDPGACAEPSGYGCGTPITDACGNGCGSLGTICPPGAVCAGAGCVPIGSTPGTAIASCAALKTMPAPPGSGSYWLDPDGTGGQDPLQVYCDMTTYGGGWTRCLSINYFSGSKPAGWTKSTWLSSSWKTGATSVFDDTKPGTSFGNVCPQFASKVAEIFGTARYGTGSGWTALTTPAMAFSQNVFAAGGGALLSGPQGSAIGVDSSNTGRYGSACSTIYTGGTNQGIQSICFHDGSHQQTMHTGWPCGNYPISCGDSCNQPCFCSQDQYCGGSNAQEDEIVMTLYVR